MARATFDLMQNGKKAGIAAFTAQSFKKAQAAGARYLSRMGVRKHNPLFPEWRNDKLVKPSWMKKKRKKRMPKSPFGTQRRAMFSGRALNRRRKKNAGRKKVSKAEFLRRMARGRAKAARARAKQRNARRRK